jgi:predicted TIM-barrel fold metal-dependent hydrolase
MFYIPALMCTHDGMGPERIALGIDYPIENVGEALQFMKDAPICDEEKEMIYHGNAEALLNVIERSTSAA